MADKRSKFRRFIEPHVEAFSEAHDEHTQQGLKWILDQDHEMLVALLACLVEGDPEKLRAAPPPVLTAVRNMAAWALIEQMLRLAEEEDHA